MALITRFVGPVGRFAAAPLAGAPAVYRGLGGGRWPLRDGTGAGRITDVVTLDGQPVERRVRAFCQRSGTLLAETRSGPDGSYTLTGLAPGWLVTVIADDHTGVYNSVCAARVSAV